MTEQKVIRHKWGVEVVWADYDSFGARMMLFTEDGGRTDMQFQYDTDKSWFVSGGKFIVRYIDTETGETFSKELVEGEVFEIPRLLPVSLEAVVKGSTLSEVNNGIRTDDIKIICPSEKINVTQII